MSTRITHSLANFPDGYCWPASPQTYGTDLIALLTSVLAGDSVGVVMGNTLPAVEDQDKVWVRLDENGYLEGIYTFQGVWHRPHPIPPSSHQRIIWEGTEEQLWAFDGGSGQDPASVTPGGSDGTVGAMWEVATSFQFRIPIGAGTNPTAYNDEAATTLNVGDTAGAEKVPLTLEEMAHTHVMGRMEAATGQNADDVSLLKAAATPNKQSGASLSSPGPGESKVEKDISNLTGDYLVTGPAEFDDDETETSAINNLPPVKAVYFAKRTARRLITVTS